MRSFKFAIHNLMHRNLKRSLKGGGHSQHNLLKALEASLNSTSLSDGSISNDGHRSVRLYIKKEKIPKTKLH